MHEEVVTLMGHAAAVLDRMGYGDDASNVRAGARILAELPAPAVVDSGVPGIETSEGDPGVPRAADDADSPEFDSESRAPDDYDPNHGL